MSGRDRLAQELCYLLPAFQRLRFFRFLGSVLCPFRHALRKIPRKLRRRDGNREPVPYVIHVQTIPLGPASANIQDFCTKPGSFSDNSLRRISRDSGIIWSAAGPLKREDSTKPERSGSLRKDVLVLAITDNQHPLAATLTHHEFEPVISGIDRDERDRPIVILS